MKMYSLVGTGIGTFGSVVINNLVVSQVLSSTVMEEISPILVSLSDASGTQKLVVTSVGAWWNNGHCNH